MAPVDQAREVERVKRAESGMIAAPVTVRPNQSLRDALDVMNEHDIAACRWWRAIARWASSPRATSASRRTSPSR